MKSIEITVEYCPKCNWMMRAAWIAQEILYTFEAEIEKVSLKPSSESGSFRIWAGEQLIFDRKENGGFAEPKIYKQLIRDVIAPDKNLGHSEGKI
jgi:selenoprotein W-related protein